jgi:hypothetical protein
MGGCPILCVLCKGWDTRRSVSRFVVSHPPQKARRMGHPALCRKTFPRKVRGTADPSAAPDFLLSPMGSAKLMRLSLMKAASEVIFGAA